MLGPEGSDPSLLLVGVGWVSLVVRGRCLLELFVFGWVGVGLVVC